MGRWTLATGDGLSYCLIECDIPFHHRSNLQYEHFRSWIEINYNAVDSTVNQA